MANDSTALARLEQSASQVITTAPALTARIREWNQLAHVLTPVVQVSALAPQHAVNVAVVLIDTKIDDRGIGADTYGLDKDGKGLPWLRKGERALGKTSLLKIAAAAGINWDAALSGRTDDRKERYYWEYKAVGHYVGFDGTPQTIMGTFELDLRDGSPALKGFGPNQIDATRKSGLRICESKAMNAAIRTLGLRQKYTVDELAKPFVCLRTTFVPDMKDPLQRQLVAERALNGTAALYPGRRLDAGRADDVIDVEPVHAQAGETTETAAGTVNTTTGEIVDEKEPAPQTTTTTEPQAPQGPTIVSIRTQNGVTRDSLDADGRVVKKGGRPFTRHFITLSDGREVHTFDASIGAAAEKCRAAKTPIDVTTQDSKWGLDIVELMPASARLPLDDDGPTEADLGGMKL